MAERPVIFFSLGWKTNFKDWIFEPSILNLMIGLNEAPVEYISQTICGMKCFYIPIHCNGYHIHQRCCHISIEKKWKNPKIIILKLWD